MQCDNPDRFNCKYCNRAGTSCAGPDEVTMMKCVFLNEKGEYLQWYEVSSHGVNKVHSFSWGALNDATVATHLEFDKLKWKSAVPTPVASLPAKVIRSVEITNPPIAPAAPL